MPIAVLIGLVGVVVVVSIAWDADAGSGGGDDDPVVPAPSGGSSTLDPGGGAEPTVPPDQLVQVDRVWLIDRGDATFDWGVSVRTPSIAPTRSGVVIDVRLLDAAGDVVETSRGVVDGVGPDSIGAVAGRSTRPERDPVRIEFDVEVGVASNDRGLGELLSLRAVERTVESVSGRIDSNAPDTIQDVTMVLLWIDDEGDVVAALPQAVDRIRPDVEVRFDIDLGDEVVPESEPDSVVWTR